MEKIIITSWESAPIMLSVPQAAQIMGISRSNMYQLTHSKGFPVLVVHSRLLIPKEQLRVWINKNTRQETT